MRVENLLTIVLVISFLSLLISFFSFIYSYSAYIEIKRILPYVRLPLPEIRPSTAIFPTEITARFIQITSSLALGLSFLIFVLILILIFKKK